MPEALKSELKKRAAEKGVRDPDAYVYGTLRKTGWKPRREKRTAKDAGDALARRT